MKKLRKKYSPKIIRFYHCGEYGEINRRPHYHACLFNHDWDDKIPFKQLKSGVLYTSPTLTKLWGLGHASCGAVTLQSAAYCARYIMKKINGDQAQETREIIDTETGQVFELTHYQEIDQKTGEIHDIAPEYTTMSLKPGIGAKWLDKYASDLYPGNFAVLDGRKSKIPKAYDKIYEQDNPKDYRKLRFQRIRRAATKKEDNTPERLRVREQVQIARLNLLPRNLEE